MERGAGAKALTEPRAIGTLPMQWREEAAILEQRGASSARVLDIQECADELSASLAALAAQIAPIVQEMREHATGHVWKEKQWLVTEWANKLAEIAEQLGGPEP